MTEDPRIQTIREVSEKMSLALIDVGDFDTAECHHAICDALDDLATDPADARVPGKPPYRIAGIPRGIISADDYDVTDEALAALARLSTEKEAT